ncbi:hypothetical protein FWC63_01120 [Candidatus Saccharibacteria bacterium]|nr:hypothetical protein [Candidatus Saccharibacteria bacterium]
MDLNLVGKVSTAEDLSAIKIADIGKNTVEEISLKVTAGQQMNGLVRRNLYFRSCTTMEEYFELFRARSSKANPFRDAFFKEFYRKLKQAIAKQERATRVKLALLTNNTGSKQVAVS